MNLQAIKIALIIILFCIAAPIRAAELKLASYFGDHMVLQRDQPIHVWGDGDAGTEVTVTVAGQEASAKTGADGHWDVALKPTPASRATRLVVRCGDKSVALDDVLFGDVWLCSGQSNMQMPLKECEDAQAVAKQTDRYPNLRLCTVGKGWNAKPQTKADITWRTNSPETSLNFSAVAYYFGSELQAGTELANVPIGLIDSSFGGTTCEGWIPNPALAKFDAKDLHDSMFGIKPGMLYNGMIVPLGRSPIKGVIWYQGEANAERPATYPKLLSTMIAEWREQFASPDLPMIVVQLPDFAPASNGLHWSWIREAQAKAVASIPHSALAQSINTTDGFDLHSKQKHEIGRRAALLARHDFYNEKVVARGPIFKDATVDGASIRVNFDTGGDGLASSARGAIRGFAIAGDDGLYRFADATIEGDSVILRSDRVAAPKTVRYAWAGIPDSTLVNHSGLPAAPFRTDDRPPGGFEMQKQPAARHLATALYEITITADGQISSLGIGGKQFLSNALGSAGGTSIPGFLGARSLANIEQLGPDLVSCSDSQVTLLISCKRDEMEWTLTNRGKDPFNFRIALSSLVAVSPAKERVAEPITLTRGVATLMVTGIDSISNSEDGRILEVTVKPHSEKRLLLQASKK